MNNKENESNNTSSERRELLKSLATVPALAAFLIAFWQKWRRDALKKTNFKITVVCLFRRPKYNSKRSVRIVRPVFY